LFIELQGFLTLSTPNFRHSKLTIFVKFVILNELEFMATTKNVTFSYQEFENPAELKPEDQELISAAKEAANHAYAPYSRFRVGAAVRLESGIIVRGSNVENAAFPSGICAERTAISGSVTNYPDDKPLAIAIAAMTDEGLTAECVSPCGNCRQVIAEEEMRTGKQIRIILSGRDKIRVIEGINLLLPLQFCRDNLRLNLP
jgi:cytidine deaminase